jgi:hypothetical protein
VIERRYAAGFAHLYSSDALKHANQDDLADLFRAAQLYAFHSPDPAAIDDMRAAHAELTARGAAMRFHDLSLHRALLWHRRFEDAAALAEKTGLDVPRFHARPLATMPPGTASAWAVAQDGLGIEQRALRLDGEPRIVMLAQPHCGFSQRAMAAILRSPEASDLFARNASILVPPKSGFDLAAVHRWNMAQPRLAMAFANAESEWPGFTLWETPVFYFIRNDKVVARRVGWPDDDRTKDLLRVARQHGFAVPAPQAGSNTQDTGMASSAAKNARTSSSERVRANGGSESRKVRP